MFAKLYLRTKVFRISGRCGHPGDTTRSENFRFDRFSLSRRYFPTTARRRSLAVVRSGAPRHDVALAHGGGPSLSTLARTPPLPRERV